MFDFDEYAARALLTDHDTGSGVSYWRRELQVHSYTRGATFIDSKESQSRRAPNLDLLNGE